MSPLMSALPSKAEIGRRHPDVCFVFESKADTRLGVLGCPSIKPIIDTIADIVSKHEANLL